MLHGDRSVNDIQVVEQTAIIRKMHRMRWLRSDSQLFGHTKVLFNGRNTKSRSLTEDVNKVAGESTSILSSPIREDNLDTKESINFTLEANNRAAEEDYKIKSCLSFSGNLNDDMETVWKKDVNSTNRLIDAQSLVLQRLEEQEMMSMALAESLVSAQIEKFKLDDDKKDKPETCTVMSAIDSCGTTRENTDTNNGNEPKGSKECHDSNNNKAKSELMSEMEAVVQNAVPHTEQEHTQATSKEIQDDTSTAGCNLVKSKSLENSEIEGDHNGKNIHADLKCSSEAESSRSAEKQNKVEGFKSRQSFPAKGRSREQDFGRTSVPVGGVSGSKNRYSTNNTFKPQRADIDRKNVEVDNAQKCHKVQVNPTQSYNNQYIRSKSLLKTRSRCSRTITKSDQDLSRRPSTSNSHTNNPTDHRTRYTATRTSSMKDGLNRKYDQPDTKRETDQMLNQRQHPHSAGAHIAGGNGNQSSKIPFANPASYQKPSNERYEKESSNNAQSFRRESSVFKRSSEHIDSKFPRSKVGEPRNYTSSSSAIVRNTGIENSSKYSSNSSNPRPHTAVAPNVTKESHVHDTKSQDTKLNNTKDTEIGTGAPKPREQKPPQESVSSQIVKQPESSTNMKKTVESTINNTEIRSVKFSENLEQINTKTHPTSTYNTDKLLQHNRLSTNPFFTDPQNMGQANTIQIMENPQNIPEQNYFDHTMSYTEAPQVNMYSTEQEAEQLDQMQTKDGQMLHTPVSNCIPQNIPNIPTAVGNGYLSYQNTPGMYFNQYNSMYNVLRKPTDGTSTSQPTSVPNTPLYTTTGNQSLMQGDSTNLMMSGGQAVAMQQAGLHSQPVPTQHDQWNMAHPDLIYFGNMMNGVHPLSVPMQGPRPMCPADYNALQHGGYLQHPLFYMPQVCMQGWNPLLSCSGQLVQNPQYAAACNPMGHQVLPPNSIMEPVSCPVSGGVQNSSYKSFQPTENNYRKDCSSQKLDNSSSNMHGYANRSAANVKGKDNAAAIDAHLRASQFYNQPNEQQNYSHHDAQSVTPSYAYATPIVGGIRTAPGCGNTQAQMYKKYPVQRTSHISPNNYSRMPPDASAFNTRDYGRKDSDYSKNDTECIPPMVSPRECMFYGINYSRKTDYIPNPTLKSEMKR